MREEFEKMAAAGKLERQQIEALVQLTDTGFCMHRSWGFGRIKTVDTVFARFTIDFENKPGHTMDLAFAAESLKPIPRDHILARKALDLEGLRQMAATQHLDLVKLVLNSYGGKATADQIQQVLVPDLVRADWKRSWDATRRELKKDGHFDLPFKRPTPSFIRPKRLHCRNGLGGLPDGQRIEGPPCRRRRTAQGCHDLTDKAAAASEIIATLKTESPAISGRSRRSHSKLSSSGTTSGKWPACRPTKAK